MSHNGSFVWYDLMTTDLAAAKDFYCAVVGMWSMTPFGDGVYEMWTVRDTPIGGLNPLPAGAPVPPHWLAYVRVDDVDAGLAKVEQLGGTTMMRMTMDNVGIVGIFADPQGGVMALFQPESDATANPNEPGYITWHELTTSDLGGAWSFDQQLFGWKTTSTMDMGPSGLYRMFATETWESGPSVGGMYDMGERPVTAWMYYITVPDLEGAISRVKEHGGQVVNGPMAVPGGDRVAQCVDPQGAHFALHQLANS